MPLSLKSSKYTDPGLNKLKKTNLHFATNPYVLYQDPTWLGFKLLFFFIVLGKLGISDLSFGVFIRFEINNLY